MVFPWDVCYVAQFHWLHRDLFEMCDLYGVLSLASNGNDGRFPFVRKNGTYFSTGNFSNKKEYLLRYYSFLVFTGMIEKSCSICGVPIVSSSLVN